MKIRTILCGAVALSMLTLCGCAASPTVSETPETTADTTTETVSTTAAAETTVSVGTGETTLTLIGHASAKIKTADGKVIYIDPAHLDSNGLYSEPADLILITHSHTDHNMTVLVTKKDTCTTITAADLHPTKDEYTSVDIDGINVTAVAAENSNHSILSCVGYVITVDDKTIYHAGDTSTLELINEQLSGLTIDYAMYPIDGTYNMNAEEATAFANSIGAVHNIPIHIDSVNSSYNEEKAKTFTPDGALYMAYGSTITL